MARHEELIREIKKNPILIPVIESIRKYPNLQQVLMGNESFIPQLTEDEHKILRELEHVDERTLRFIINSQQLSNKEIDKIVLPEEDVENLTTGEEIYKYVNELYQLDNIKKLTDDQLNELQIYLLNKGKVPDGRIQPWKAINERSPYFSLNIKKILNKKKTGKGIQFLPSDSKELFIELNRLMASGKAGNTNVFNEIGAITDELRRKGFLSIDQIKKIYKEIK